MSRQMVKIRLQWLPPEKGGRRHSFAGERYTPTARFAGENEQFSVVIRFLNAKLPNPTQGLLGLLNPDLAEIQVRMRPQAELEIMEGSRLVAHCVVASVPEEVAEQLAT